MKRKFVPKQEKKGLKEENNRENVFFSACPMGNWGREKKNRRRKETTRIRRSIGALE